MQKKKKTIVSITRFAQEEGYPDIEKLAKEAEAADALFDVAGIPHIWVERWMEYIQKLAGMELRSRSKTGNTLADTQQLGIIRSNLKRLPGIIQKKERRLRAVKALLKDATSDDEKWSLLREQDKLESDLPRHRNNFKKAEAGERRFKTERAAELDDLESGNDESGETQDDDSESPEETASK